MSGGKFGNEKFDVNHSFSKSDEETKMSLATCPFCDYEFQAEDILENGKTNFPTESDGDETDTICLNCNKPFRITLSMEPSWSFADKDGNEL